MDGNEQVAKIHDGKMMTRGVVAVAVAIAMLVACGENIFEGGDEASRTAAQTDVVVEDQEDGPHADHMAARNVVIDNPRSVQEHFGDDGIAHFSYEEPFRQVGWRLKTSRVDQLAYRVRSRDGDWSQWTSVDPYWNEEDLHNAHAVLDDEATELQMRGGEAIDFAAIDFFDEITARSQIITGDEDRANWEGEDLATVNQAVAPSGMVTTRHQWDAIQPDKVCGSVVAPWRMAIHHTASPSSDGGNPHVPMRGMQNYHMNTLGWCDIGYHFVVAQSGEIMQGRSRSNRPGAHVGGQNSGNVGIGMIGNYSSTSPPQVQLDNVVRIVRWVHEEHGVPLNRDRVRGHREHAGQSTACPGNVGLSHLDWIVDQASDDPAPPEPDPEYDVDLQVLVHGLDDFYSQGTSQSVPDALPGDEFNVEIRMSNQSTDVIRGVQLGYSLDALGLEATNYRIESDHPNYDQDNWEINSADGEEANPDRDALGASGMLVMHAFSPNETKRVVISLKATDYSLGLSDVQGLKTWLQNADDVYGVQDSFGSSPSTNEIGERVEDSARVDVLSRAQWQFQTGASEDLEGWTGDGTFEELSINTSHDLLAQKIDGDEASITSPSWTEIDADTYDEMVIRVRSHDGTHTKALYWASDGGAFEEGRSVRFDAPGDSEYHTLVVPLGEHPQWKGVIDRLNLRLLDGEAPGEDDSGWYDVDFIYFQNYADELTTSSTMDVAGGDPVAIDFPGYDEPAEPTPPRSDEPGATHREYLYADGFPGATQEGGVQTNSGCSSLAATQGSLPAEWAILLMVLGWMVWRRREPRDQPAA